MVADFKVAPHLSFDSGTVVVDDRDYNDYRLFARWTERACTIMTANSTNRHDNSVCPYFPFLPLQAEWRRGERYRLWRDDDGMPEQIAEVWTHTAVAVAVSDSESSD